jgi:multicomponent Na+:H+ antiporter subunit A
MSTMILASVISLFLLALAAPLVSRAAGRYAGWLLATVPAGWAAWYAGHIGRIGGGEVIRPEPLVWVELLGVSLSTRMDGLTLMFALLVTGVGALVTVYAGGYLAGHHHLGRFYAYLIAFMASMLGLVVSDNLIGIFIFWELTSVTSFLLIGFGHDRAAARTAALQAVIVTGLGGLALMAGLILMGMAAGTFEFGEMIDRGVVLGDHPLYIAILTLVCLGAFTKSAQVPFHFWLPGAMEAPAPVSAYLHSSTMVKAGVFLLAKFSPVLGGTTEWAWTLQIVGGVTMVYAAFLAARAVYFKRILAFTTVSSLGAMVMLLGVGGPGETAAMGFLLAHAMYKGTLFMVAGTVEHQTHVKDVEKLSGLMRIMPVTFAAAALGAASMAGLPPFFGFTAKYLMKGPLAESVLGSALVVGVLAMGVFMTVAALLVAYKPFAGRPNEAAAKASEAGAALLLGPVVLAIAGVIAGLLPGLFAGPLVESATAAVTGQSPEKAMYASFHLVNTGTLVSTSTLAIVLGVGLYAVRVLLRRSTAVLERIEPVVSGPVVFQALMSGTLRAGALQTRVLQNGSLNTYIRTTMLGFLGLAIGLGAGRITGGLLMPTEEKPTFLGMILVVMMMLSGVAATVFRYRLAAVAALGVAGVASALIFVYYGAPDVAMTQFAIETLTVLIFVLVFYHLPQFTNYTGKLRKAADWTISLLFGGVMGVLVMLAARTDLAETVSGYFSENAYPLAKGRNIVNVIIVDFRAADTFGELVVLGIAGVGVATLLCTRTRARVRRAKPAAAGEGDAA